MNKINRREESSEVNTDYPGCVDGRQAIFVLEYNNETKKYELAFNTEQLKGHNYPQILGAALGFVAAAEVNMPGFSMEAAFDFVEAAFEKAGYKPSIHVDDEHGKLKSEIDELYSAGKYEELVELILELIDGCGFAGHQWGEKASKYILEAIRRGWVIQVLTGGHNENLGGAHANYVTGTSFDVVGANEKGKPAFNQDYWFAKLVLKYMEELISGEEVWNDPGFADSSIKWLTDTYAAVVIKLGGVEQDTDIKQHLEIEP